jgi:hypothetical protein
MSTIIFTEINWANFDGLIFGTGIVTKFLQSQKILISLFIKGETSFISYCSIEKKDDFLWTSAEI